ncbi:hypothetical protein HPB51_012723 [Rhipicephalus microplus]|uniref:Uncharacterized protein n=1 Tax=Rhipicephalus microplus TaxID=6941 RepID=A0A9J6E917_RHIMP|nr:hypothetical protein HPB51_012723 [Rhipicephalus microplus]
MDIIARLPEAESPTGLTFENLDHLERVFREAVGPGKELNREQFRQIVQSRNAFFAERMFQLFDNGQVWHHIAWTSSSRPSSASPRSRRMTSWAILFQLTMSTVMV